MKKIRVLVFGLSSNYGGIERYVYNHYKKMNHNLVVFDFIDVSDTCSSIAYSEEFKKMNSKIYKITKRNVNWIRSYQELKSIINNNEYDFIHFHIMNFMWWEPIYISYKYGKSKIIIHSHNSRLDKKHYLKNKLLDTIGRIMIKRINYYKLACGILAGEYLFKNKKFQIMENGIKIEDFIFSQKHRNKIRNEFNIDNNCTLFGHVGNFYIAKNYPKLIDIFNEYLKFDSNAKLMLIGNDNNDPSVRKKVKILGINDKVIFVGQKNNVNEFYSAFDIFLFPSLYEGLSISMIEAQISGLICYASNTIDISTKITNNLKFIDINDYSYNISKYIFNDFSKIDRNKIKYDKKYDINITSKKLQTFYEEKL